MVHILSIIPICVQVFQDNDISICTQVPHLKGSGEEGGTVELFDEAEIAVSVLAEENRARAFHITMLEEENEELKLTNGKLIEQIDIFLQEMREGGKI